jgi:hypothetical protein
MNNFETVLKYLGAGVIVFVAFTVCNRGTTFTEPDAAAQDAGTNGNCCNIPSQMQVVSADQDPAQMVRGSVEITNTRDITLAQGPFVLTDASTGNGAVAVLFAVPDGTTCEFSNLRDDRWVATVDTGGPVNGARIIIPAGQTLCAGGTYNASHHRLSWAGFTPY